jgi:hypothetical protein
MGKLRVSFALASCALLTVACSSAPIEHVHSTGPLSREQAREFGFSGSVNTAAACAAAGGAFLGNVFGWMVHVYPFENDVAEQF